jgi:hypothetical protein
MQDRPGRDRVTVRDEVMVCVPVDFQALFMANRGPSVHARPAPDDDGQPADDAFAGQHAEAWPGAIGEFCVTGMRAPVGERTDTPASAGGCGRSLAIERHHHRDGSIRYGAIENVPKYS